ncbi:Fumble domain-containing protein [Candidatus Bathyarchaeota archaeon]|nr:Fumble domain-containing protein [Candidatus Bathyarchaeota archaeon]
MILGLDVGASFAKAILVDENLKIIEKQILPVEDLKTAALRTLNSFIRKIDEELRGRIGVVAASGGGSRFIGEEAFGLPVKRIDEITAIGLGGLLLANRDEGLVVSAGTGTAIVAVYNGGRTIKHVGGTGVGGGTVLGLSRRLLGLSIFEDLENMALKGDAGRVDLTVGDIVGGPIGIIPADATASNLGKLTCKSKAEDVAAGIFNMVSQTIGVLAAMAAKAYDLENSIILVGMLPKSKIVSKIICETIKMFGAEVVVPGDCEYASALGAAASIYRQFDSLHAQTR